MSKTPFIAVLVTATLALDALAGMAKFTTCLVAPASVPTNMCQQPLNMAAAVVSGIGQWFVGASTPRELPEQRFPVQPPMTTDR